MNQSIFEISRARCWDLDLYTNKTRQQDKYPTKEKTRGIIFEQRCTLVIVSFYSTKYRMRSEMEQYESQHQLPIVVHDLYHVDVFLWCLESSLYMYRLFGSLQVALLCCKLPSGCGTLRGSL